MAARICLVLAAIVYIAALTAILMAFSLNASNAAQILPTGTVGILLAILGGTAVVLAVLGTTYLFCGLNMAGEKFRAVLVAAIVGAIHAIVTLEALFILTSQSTFIRPVLPRTYTLTLTLSLATLLCLAPMIYFTVRTLQVRR